MGMSTYLKNSLYDGVLRATDYVSPATVYLALYTTDPTDADVGAEVAGGSYARQVATFSAPVNGIGANDSLLTYPTATAPWGTVGWWGIRDALVAGNLLNSGAFNEPRDTISGDTLKVNIGDLDVVWA